MKLFLTALLCLFAIALFSQNTGDQLFSEDVLYEIRITSDIPDFMNTLERL